MVASFSTLQLNVQVTLSGNFISEPFGMESSIFSPLRFINI